MIAMYPAFTKQHVGPCRRQVHVRPHTMSTDVCKGFKETAQTTQFAFFVRPLLVRTFVSTSPVSPMAYSLCLSCTDDESPQEWLSRTTSQRSTVSSVRFLRSHDWINFLHQDLVRALVSIYVLHQFNAAYSYNCSGNHLAAG
jgi:hypothetical protein